MNVSSISAIEMPNCHIGGLKGMRNTIATGAVSGIIDNQVAKGPWGAWNRILTDNI